LRDPGGVRPLGRRLTPLSGVPPRHRRCWALGLVPPAAVPIQRGFASHQLKAKGAVSTAPFVVQGPPALKHVHPSCPALHRRKTRWPFTTRARRITLGGMCRNIRTLHNFEPPASQDEIEASALQYVRKISGFTKPSQANEQAFAAAIEAVTAASTELLDQLVTNAPPKNREEEAAKAKARAAERYAA
jgi:hypothetical protein